MTRDADEHDPVGAGLHLAVAAESSQVSVLRGLLGDWACRRGLPDELVLDMQLAADEAISNVVMHAYPADAPGMVSLSAHQETEAVVVTVADTGRWRPGAARPGGGRGIRLMRALVPGLTITTGPAGTSVRLTWLCPAG